MTAEDDPGKGIGWIEIEDAIDIHDEQIERHGGLPGLRDGNLLGSALSRPINRCYYEGVTDIPTLAAGYLFGMARNHPFVDANKRTSYIVTTKFMERNGYEVQLAQPRTVDTMVAVARGDMTEEQVADWIRSISRPLARDG